MTKYEILQYIHTNFLPLTLASPDELILQNLANVIRFWNTNSAHRILEMYDAGSVITISPEFKNVVQVLPSKQSTSMALADPTWTLLGIQALNYLTSDFIALNEAYKTYQSYLGNDFRFTFEPNQDPTIGGKLYTQRIPSQASKLAVIGTKRILPDEDIKSEYVLDHILRGVIAHTKISEGNTLRKATTIGIANDGQQMLEEGKAEWDALKEEIHKNARWFSFSSRI